LAKASYSRPSSRARCSAVWSGVFLTTLSRAWLTDAVVADRPISVVQSSGSVSNP